MQKLEIILTINQNMGINDLPHPAKLLWQWKKKREKKEKKENQKRKKEKKKLNIVKHTVSKVLCFKNYMAFHICCV